MHGRTFRRRKKKKLKVPDVPKTCNEMNKSYNLMCKWMGEKGYKSSKTLKPKIFPGYGRGLMTEESIHSGDIILAIPQNLLITCELVLQSELGSLIKHYCPNASGHETLTLFLMVEKAKGKTSEWHPYIETLPDSYNIPAFYGRQCLSFVPSYIYPQATKQVKTTEDSFGNLRKLFKVLEHAYPYLHGNLEFAVFKWAWCTVNTRCVFIDCLNKDCIGMSCKFHMALAPFLDFLNHSVEVQVQAGFNRKNKCYEIVSLCEYKKYSQVFINYGSHDNCSLFVEYGFVVPNNYNDAITISIDDIILAYQQSGFSSGSLNRKLKFISENNLIKKSVCSCDGLSWNLSTILKILTSDYDIKWWKTRLGNYLDFEFKEDKFKILQKRLLTAKLKGLANTSINEEPTCEYSSFQLQISQLSSIISSILINTMQ